ncbi:hypothetical protein LCGC14_2701290 [marine sediment metagenome]|uniref:Uncharacterized protein n=1 Tax=marine sediment metagenome TaxID=412755 RepID=A0A0F9A395_9ZZZZ
MTRKDYAAIASAFVRASAMIYNPGENDMWDELRDQITNVIAANNPRFDRDKFFNACEGTP